ncbi:MAG: hypothetical protein J2P17_19760 [Mycobacterium sp.]|nr:hypothetical protein [Mycobacterium sp.]
MAPTESTPANGVMVISVRPREGTDDLLVRISTALDDDEAEVVVTTRDDEVLAAVDAFLRMMHGKKLKLAN